MLESGLVFSRENEGIAYQTKGLSQDNVSSGEQSSVSEYVFAIKPENQGMQWGAKK